MWNRGKWVKTSQPHSGGFAKYFDLAAGRHKKSRMDGDCVKSTKRSF